MTLLTDIVPISLIEKIIGLALCKGADFSEIYLERGYGNSISIEEQKIRTVACGVSLGMGIRVISGNEVGYAYCDELDAKSLEKTALVAANIASAKKNIGHIHVSPIKTPDRYPIDIPFDKIPAHDKAQLLLEGDQIARSFDKQITQVMGSFSDTTKDILIANSKGELSTDHKTMCRLNFTTIADNKKGERTTGFSGGGGRVCFSHYKTQEASPKTLATEAARMAITQIGAVECPAGQQTVVLSPGWSGVLLHEAVGHGLEADFIHKKTSLYADKIGEKVASDLVTVIDNGEIHHKRGSLNIDDEGVIAKEKVLIEKGILKGYMFDRISANIMNTTSTGNGRRESYKHAPMPRMTNTYMSKGKHTHEEIIKSVKKGLYCASFGGGQVDISNGNFVFEVREGYLIESGKITAPVKNATLIGVGPSALKNISMVGDDLALDPGIGTCGKDGQTVPVGVGLPTVRIDNLTVGGTHVSE